MTLEKILSQLENVNREGKNKIFTMYLNTDPTDPDQQGGKWRLQFKNGMRNFEEYLQKDQDKEELHSFQHVKHKVEKFMDEHEQHLQRSVIVFATADEEVWFAQCLQVRVKSEFYWQETAETAQLETILQNYPMIGVVLVQQNEIKVVEAKLNSIENTSHYEFDIDQENWHVKQSTSKVGQAAAAKQKAGAQKDKFRAKFKANLQRWYKTIAPKLDKQAKENEWQQTYIVGEKEVTTALKQQMNQPVQSTIYKNMLDAEGDKVLAEIYG
ncbi:VLRF1 family aeRF1-type release factor [Virgibacillus halophilus]|uniref:VLRF1 family aeRF1-type release factor n=1 Tax=Tigheibacillus halophilus TaxID=361280 RepID=A0ABU5C9I7_9BACI|nr:VLRF1 family aeRF1-type release factor [Virgibacillus halophilus]